MPPSFYYKNSSNFLTIDKLLLLNLFILLISLSSLILLARRLVRCSSMSEGGSVNEGGLILLLSILRISKFGEKVNIFAPLSLLFPPKIYYNN